MVTTTMTTTSASGVLTPDASDKQPNGSFEITGVMYECAVE